MTRRSLLRKAYWNAFTLWHLRDEARLPFRPLDEIVARQRRRVEDIVGHAYATVPYYREVMNAAGLAPRDFHSADDLAKLPILTGAQLARDPARFLSRGYANRLALTLQSSGTSGFSKPISYDAAALFLALAHGQRQRHIVARFVGRMYGYREMRLARDGGVASQIRAFYESHSWVPKQIDLQRTSASPGERFEETIARWNAVAPDVVHGYGSHVGALVRHARARGLPLHRPKCVTYGADQLADADRRLIEAELGVPVVSTYQAAEALRIGFQCEERRGFHLSVDHTAVRVVDGSGDPVAPGSRGEIVISNLTNRASVVLNYKLGDVVTLGARPCPCGRTLPTIERIDGRADDFILLEDGRRIHALVALAPLLRVRGVIQVQLVQEDVARGVLHVVCAAGREWSAVHRDLGVAWRSTPGGTLALHIQRADAIPAAASGKVKAVISRCGN